jgi:RNA polymerase sigma-70 factor (ECF subfamily)
LEGLPADQPETLALLDRAATGDRQALGELLDRERAAVRRFVELRIDGRLRGRVDESDVVQEAYLEAVRRMTDYLTRRPMPFRVWVYRTAHEYLLRLRRQHLDAACRAAGLEVPLPDESSVVLARQSTGAGPGGQAAAAELARRVRDALARLDPTDRDVLLLRTFEGLGNQEVARVLDLAPAAASKRYGRALIRLRGALAGGDKREADA